MGFCWLTKSILGQAALALLMLYCIMASGCAESPPKDQGMVEQLFGEVDRFKQDKEPEGVEYTSHQQFPSHLVMMHTEELAIVEAYLAREDLLPTTRELIEVWRDAHLNYLLVYRDLEEKGLQPEQATEQQTALLFKAMNQLQASKVVLRHDYMEPGPIAD